MKTDRFSESLWMERQSRAVILPIRAKAYDFIDSLLQVLFPHFAEIPYHSASEISDQLNILSDELISALRPLAFRIEEPIQGKAEAFFDTLPRIYGQLWRDAEAIQAGDPAAESVDEVISAYPGFQAIAVYRIAHEFYRLGIPIFPRILTEHSHHRTGIDIHPGAEIGDSFFIDHGTGIVVGETSKIGNNVKIYQGVTLGALSVSKAFSDAKRHPTIEDNVVIYSNATILGGETTIGHDSVIGGNVWLTESVEPYSVVYHRSEINVRSVRGENEPINFSI